MPQREMPKVEVTSRAALRAWLRKHHRTRGSIWLVTFKKEAGRSHVPYDAIVDEALCFGWVDSLPRSLDGLRSMRRLSPRAPTSAWSKANKTRAARLIREKRMTRAGLAAIAAAKKNGSWSRLDAVEALRLPPDLQAALAASPSAERNLAAFPRSVKRAILEWITQAKRPETRARRIAETVREAARNRRANQYRQPKGSAAPRAARKRGSA
jgi:uncharacterized protein YdeI (YjbR/CyaY-like superfamily)